jgi:ribosomal protein L37AE/L43A
MKTPSRTSSRPRHIICPACGSGELWLRGSGLVASCDSCGLSVEGAAFRTLEQIAVLPDALGSHACECGHPEMRRLPDGVYHCPACGSEILPIETPFRSQENAPRIGLGTEHWGRGPSRAPVHRYASRVRGG